MIETDNNLVRLILADSSRILSEGLEALVNGHDRIEVAARADSASRVINLLDTICADVLVTETLLCGMDGPTLCRQVLERWPKLRVVALTGDPRTRTVADMFQAGASGYLLKSCSFDEFCQAISWVAEGQRYISPYMAGPLVEGFILSGGQSGNSNHLPLSPRERKIMTLVVEGLSTKQIAFQLRVTTRTVDAHRQRIMDKLNLNSIAELTKFAIREGITSLES